MALSTLMQHTSSQQMKTSAISLVSRCEQLDDQPSWHIGYVHWDTIGGSFWGRILRVDQGRIHYKLPHAKIELTEDMRKGCNNILIPDIGPTMYRTKVVALMPRVPDHMRGLETLFHDQLVDTEDDVCTCCSAHTYSEDDVEHSATYCPFCKQHKHVACAEAAMVARDPPGAPACMPLRLSEALAPLSTEDLLGHLNCGRPMWPHINAWDSACPWCQRLWSSAPTTD